MRALVSYFCSIFRETCEHESKRSKYEVDLPAKSSSGKFSDWIYRQIFGNSPGQNRNLSDRGVMSDQQKHKPIQMPSNPNLHQQNIPKQMFQMKYKKALLKSQPVLMRITLLQTKYIF